MANQDEVIMLVNDLGKLNNDNKRKIISNKKKIKFLKSDLFHLEFKSLYKLSYLLEYKEIKEGLRKKILYYELENKKNNYKELVINDKLKLLKDEDQNNNIFVSNFSDKDIDISSMVLDTLKTKEESITKEFFKSKKREKNINCFLLYIVLEVLMMVLAMVLSAIISTLIPFSLKTIYISLLAISSCLNTIPVYIKNKNYKKVFYEFKEELDINKSKSESIRAKKNIQNNEKTKEKSAINKDNLTYKVNISKSNNKKYVDNDLYKVPNIKEKRQANIKVKIKKRK